MTDGDRQGNAGSKDAPPPRAFGDFGSSLDTASKTPFWQWFHMEQTGRENDLCRFQPDGDKFHDLCYLDVKVASSDAIQALTLGVQRSFIDGRDAPFARDLVKSFLYAAFSGQPLEPLSRLIREIESEFGGSRPVIVSADMRRPAPDDRPSDAYQAFLGRKPDSAMAGSPLALRSENRVDAAIRWFCIHVAP